MNGNEPTSQTDSGLAAQVRSLQLALTVSLACSVLLGLTLAGYLYGQYRTTSRDLEGAHRMIDSYNTNAVPLLRSLQQNLQTYATAHPDLMPILIKYGMAATNRPGGGPSMGGSAPGATTPRK